jgi:hypothetical protein
MSDSDIDLTGNVGTAETGGTIANIDGTGDGPAADPTTTSAANAVDTTKRGRGGWRS